MTLERRSHATLGPTGPHREAWGECGGSGTERRAWARYLLWVLWEGMAESGYARQTGLGLDSLKNFSELWVISLVPSCLVPSPGMMRPGGECPKLHEFHEKSR